MVLDSQSGEGWAANACSMVPTCAASFMRRSRSWGVASTSELKNWRRARLCGWSMWTGETLSSAMEAPLKPALAMVMAVQAWRAWINSP